MTAHITRHTKAETSTWPGEWADESWEDSIPCVGESCEDPVDRTRLLGNVVVP